MRATLGFLRTTAAATALVGALAVHDVARAGDAPRAIDAIENDLVADDPAVRAKAAAELTDRFPDGAVAVPMLEALLDDDAPQVVSAATASIESLLVPAAERLATYCLEPSRFTDPNGFGGRLDGVLSIWTRTPMDAVGGRRVNEAATTEGCAVAALTRRDSPTHESWWRTALLDANRGSAGETREMAAAALCLFGGDSLVSRRLPAPTDARRAALARRLVPLVASSDPVRSFCGSRLAERLRVGDGGLVPALADAALAEKETAKQRDGAPGRFAARAAADALAAIGPAASAASPRLTELVRRRIGDEPSIVRAPLVDRAVRALFFVGGETAIKPLLDDPELDRLRVAASAAAAGCSAAFVLPTLTESASRPDASPLSFNGLAALGPSATPALQLVRERLAAAKDDDERWSRAETVLAVAPDDASAQDALDRMLEGQDIGGTHTAPDHVNYAWYALCERAAPTPMVVRRASAAVRSGHVIFAWVPAVEALGRAGPAAKGAVSDLVDLLDESAPGPNPRWHAIGRPVLVSALGRIGPDAAAAIPALTALRDKGDETIRVPAAQALRRIRAKK